MYTLNSVEVTKIKTISVFIKDHSLNLFIHAIKYNKFGRRYVTEHNIEYSVHC